MIPACPPDLACPPCRRCDERRHACPAPAGTRQGRHPADHHRHPAGHAARRRSTRPSWRRRCRPSARSSHDLEHLQWVVTAYLLTATAVTPLYGKLSDIHGRRMMLLIAISMFLVGSLACALAPTMIVLIARALRPGARRRRADLARPDHRRRRGLAARAHALPGLFRQRLRHLQRRRPGARRLLRPGPALVVHLLDQPAARRRRFGDDLWRAQAPAAARAAAQARRRRRAADGLCRHHPAPGAVMGRQHLSLDLGRRCSASSPPRSSPGSCSRRAC